MNSELLYITRKLGYPSSFGTRAGLGDFLEQYPDGIYAETGVGAPMGWESAAVWFGGDSERAAARFERMMSERNELSRLFRTRVSGVLVLTFIYRLKSRMVTAIPIIGGQPQPEPDALKFYMPNGGTISLNKSGSPTVVELEYSLDGGATWTVWPEDGGGNRSLTLVAGQTMHLRNTSETSTGFSTSNTNYYNFSFTSGTYAGGNINSLLCKNPQNAVITENCFNRLFLSSRLVTAPALPSTEIARGCYNYMFRECKYLESAPEVLPSTTTYPYCYYYMFEGCTLLVKAPKILAESIVSYACNSMFRNDTSLNYIYTAMTQISDTNPIANWVNGVAATGDFYCPAELTIPIGASGIPDGWTRHDI